MAGLATVVVMAGAGCSSGGDAPSGTAPTATSGGAAGDASATSDGADKRGSSPADGAPPRTMASVPPLHPSVDGYPEADVRISRPDGTAVLLVPVRVAETSAQRSHGLMEVPDLPDGTGMLFRYGEPRSGAFYMKNTLVPLDIAWMDATGTVLVTMQMDPCKEDPCPLYDPGVQYSTALEVPQGWFEAQGVEPGWRIEVVG